jgi:hypothetical protein
MSSLLRRCALIGVTVAVAACASGDDIVGPSDSSRGMIFGHFDYSDSKYIITAMTLDPADRVSIRMGGRGERVHIYKSGTFFADDLTPGKYRIAALFSGNVVFTPPAQQKMEISVGPGEVRYIGTYKLKIEDVSLFSRTGGSITRTDRNPNERELLEKMHNLVKDTGWQPKIERLLAQKRPK